MTYLRTLAFALSAVFWVPLTYSQSNSVVTKAAVTYTQIDYPGAAATGAFGINSAGDIVGEYQLTVGGPNHGFLLSNGQFTSVDYPGAAATFANSINDFGQIVGTESTQFGFPYEHGFLYDGQTFTQILVPGKVDTEANGINNAGDVVGRTGSTSRLQGFKLSGGVFTAIVAPGRYPSQGADGINNFGEIVGYRLNTTVEDIYADIGGKFHYIDLGDACVSFGLNDNGVIVGWYSTGGVQQGFAWLNGKYISLTYPGGVYSTTATGINNSGVVVGTFAETLSSGIHGFVTTPITAADFN